MKNLMIIKFNQPFDTIAWFSMELRKVKTYKRFFGPIFIRTI